MATLLDGESLAAEIKATLGESVDELTADGERPGLATVHMGEDPAAERYVELKQRNCDELGIRGRHVDVDPDAPASELHATIEALNDDPDIHGILLQKDVPDHVDWRAAIRRIDPQKDVDGVHPANVGRLVAGDPRFVPCTPHGIRKLLAAEGVPLAGADVVIVNHSTIVGKPLANLLVQDATDGSGNATVTVCHSETRNLPEKTRRADVVVVAVGLPDFLDGSMVTEGTTVVDVGITRDPDGDGPTIRGDVDFESVAPKADYITPNPGGVGPMTRVMLLYNTVAATERQSNAEPVAVL